MSAVDVVGLLYSPQVKGALSRAAAEAAVVRAAELLGRTIDLRFLAPADLATVPDVDLLIHDLGRCYHEPTWSAICDCFRRGGHLMTLGCRPFTVPFHIDGDSAEFGEPTDAALHALGIADTFVDTGPVEHSEVRDVSPRFAFLNDTHLPTMAASCSLDVRLATKVNESEPLYARHGVQEAEVDVACRLADRAGRFVAAPILRISHYDGGRWTCLNFDPSDPGFYDSTAGRELLARTIAASLREGWHLAVGSHYARYVPGERISLSVHARRLAGDDGQARRKVLLTVHEADDPDGRPLHETSMTIESNHLDRLCEIASLDEGCFTVRARLEVGGHCLGERRTGFYVLSDEAARRIAARAPRLQIDPAIAPDYCVVDGRPFPITGSTFMAPDNYRDCFADLNVAIARQEMARLRRMGVNILRAGVWTTYGLVYARDGGFREKALRSMDAYFLSAAEAGLPVQFVPSAFVMNYWNREASMFHDPVVRSRVMQCFRQFAQRYAGWPGVQLDIINEPSYAPFKHGHLWQRARPTGDPNEAVAWRDWLERRYDGDITGLRDAWGASADEMRSFDDARLPQDHEFLSNYSGHAGYTLWARLADFYAFADDTFTDWVRETRAIVRVADPKMLVMIGRDETLRIPTQQRDAAEGSIDLVNWHQWHREAAIFNEYCLNRVPGRPCCGQEMGILPYKDARNEERLNESHQHHQLERKLVYCLGNWIQWQSHSDPTMDFYGENKLGMLRVDGTERPAAGVVRLLAWLESGMADRLNGRREDRERLAVIVPTSLWFSCDTQLAYMAAARAINAIHYHLKHQAYFVLESLLRPDNRAQIGRPAAVILPSPTILAETAWQFLFDMVCDEGVTLLLTGSPQQDECWRHRDRLNQIGISAHLENLATIERLRLDERVFDCTFHEAFRFNLPGKVLLRAAPAGTTVAEPISVPLGQGRVVYCPVPVELTDAIEPVVSLYRQVLAGVPALPPPLVRVAPSSHSAAHFIHAIEYQSCTMVSMVNEGTAARLCFELTNCGCQVEADLAAGRAAVFCVDSRGHLLGGYVHARLQVGTDEIVPNGDLAFLRGDDHWKLMPGDRSTPVARLNGREIRIEPHLPREA
jgi:hypothetical protein